MEIITSAKNTTLFTSKGPGDVFMVQGLVYMKIKTIVTTSDKFNAVQLNSGTLYYFEPSNPTDDVKARLVLE